jgi:protein-L-isoaspartate(D-aspartate) O-methyltransferase
VLRFPDWVNDVGTAAAHSSGMNAIDEQDALRLLREAMVAHQLRDQDITDARILRAMARIPRHLFVPPELCWRAYEARALPIGEGQTISHPYMVAEMAEALELTGAERVLEVGTGSGYQAALLGELAREVWSLEIIPALARRARTTLGQLGYENVHVVIGDGSVGLVQHAPYDAIVVAAASPTTLPELVEQLSPGGHLVIPVGDRNRQMLRRPRRVGTSSTTESLLPCTLVPLVGEQGWSKETTDAGTACAASVNPARL